MKILNIKVLLLAGLVSLLSISCEDFLDREPLDQITDASVYTNQGYAEAFLAKIYEYLPSGFGDRGNRKTDGTGHGWYYNFGVITDEGRNKSTWPTSVSVFIPGLMTPSNTIWDSWASHYSGIRKVNEFIDGMNKSSTLDEKLTEQMVAEVRYIRAFLYFDLARRHGNVPLITAIPESLDSVDIFIPQSTQAEVYQFIDDELAAIGEVLPSITELRGTQNYGRVSKEAAWALNGRVLLYAKNYARSAEFSKKVMDSEAFTLHPDYAELFTTLGTESDEVIFEIMFKNPKFNSMDSYSSPPSVGTAGLGQFNPTQELVDAYEMTNGKYIDDPTSGYDDQNPYVNRDKRFYGTINYHGTTSRGAVLDFTVAPDMLKSTGLSTQTGYYLRKFTEHHSGTPPVENGGEVSWIELRLGEVLLNYAEAQNSTNAGADASVYAAMNEVRTRAGQPDLPAGLSQTEMMDRIERERQVELAWENHRYWDLIRWRKAVDVLDGNTFTGMRILKDSVTNALTYERFNLDHIGAQVFPEKYYLLPIPLSATSRNNLLKQPAGWE